MAKPKMLTLVNAILAVEALRDLHRVCIGMDAERQGARPTEAEYQAAMGAAAEALANCPGSGPRSEQAPHRTSAAD